MFSLARVVAIPLLVLASFLPIARADDSGPDGALDDALDDDSRAPWSPTLATSTWFPELGVRGSAGLTHLWTTELDQMAGFDTPMQVGSGLGIYAMIWRYTSNNVALGAQVELDSSTLGLLGATNTGPHRRTHRALVAIHCDGSIAGEIAVGAHAARSRNWCRGTRDPS